GPRVELAARREQRQSAADAGVHAVAFVVEQRTAERPLRALAAGDTELIRGKSSGPLRIGLDDLRRVHRADQPPLAVVDLDSHGRLLRHELWHVLAAILYERRTAPVAVSPAHHPTGPENQGPTTAVVATAAPGRRRSGPATRPGRRSGRRAAGTPP